MPTLTEPVRAWIYRVSVAAFAVAVLYGLFDDGDVEKWLYLIGAILGTGNAGLATLHTSTHNPERPEAFDGDRDRGQSVIYVLVAVLAAVALVIWIARAL